MYKTHGILSGKFASALAGELQNVNGGKVKNVAKNTMNIWDTVQKDGKISQNKVLSENTFSNFFFYSTTQSAGVQTLV